MSRHLIAAAMLAAAFLAPAQAQERNDRAPLDPAAFIRLVREHGTFREILLDELSIRYDRIIDSEELGLAVGAAAAWSPLTAAGEGGFTGGLTATATVPETGTVVRASIDAAAGGASPLPDRGTSGILLRIEQSVIRNAFGRAAGLRNRMAGHEATVARYRVLEAYEDYLAEIIGLYVSWYAAHETVRNAEASYRDAERLFARIRERERFGVAAPIDVDKGMIRLLDKEEELMAAQSAYRNVAAETARLTGADPGSFQRTPSGIDPILAMGGNADADADAAAFLSESRTARMLALFSEIGALAEDLSFDDLLPTARVYASYALDAEGFFQPGTLEHELELGFSLEVPLHSPDAAARRELSRIGFTKAKLNERNLREELGARLRAMTNDLDTGARTLSLADRRAELALRVVAAEERRYSQGTVGLDTVLAAREALDQIVRARLSLRTALARDRVERLRFTDRLVDDDLAVKSTAPGE